MVFLAWHHLLVKRVTGTTKGIPVSAAWTDWTAVGVIALCGVESKASGLGVEVFEYLGKLGD